MMLIIRIIKKAFWPIAILAVLLAFGYYFHVESNPVVKTVAILLISYIAFVFLRSMIEELRLRLRTDERMLKTVIRVLNNIVLIFIVFVSLTTILSVWGINVIPLIASVGLTGIIVGFAAKDTINNIMSGILVFVDPPFGLGDIIELEDGNAGEVVDIGLRNTKIKTFDNRVITVPNYKVLQSTLINYNMPDDVVRVTVKVGVSYDADPDFVREVIYKDVLSSVSGVLKDPKPQVLFREFGDSALIFEVWVWTKVKDRIRVMDEVNTRIWKVFREKGIEIPYPIRTVYLRK